MSQNTGKTTKTKEEIIAGFQALRAEQRQLANKISELEMDLNEHKIVLETVSGVEPGRTCFKMIGGVLVQRTAGELAPELRDTCERLPDALRALHDQLTRKGQAIRDYMQLHDIRLHTAPADADAPPDAMDSPKSNVLVPTA